MIYLLFIGYVTFISVVASQFGIVLLVALMSLLLLTVASISVVTLVVSRFFSPPLGLLESIKCAMLSSICLHVVFKIYTQVPALANLIAGRLSFIPLAILVIFALFIGHAQAADTTGKQAFILALVNLIVFPFISKVLGYGALQVFFS